MFSVFVFTSDIDECKDNAICGPVSICSNKRGYYNCSCQVGYEPLDPALEASPINICVGIGTVCSQTGKSLLFLNHFGHYRDLYLADIDECFVDPDICGPNANCTNGIGSYYCSCNSGYRITDDKKIASHSNPCIGRCGNMCLVVE